MTLFANMFLPARYTCNDVRAVRMLRALFGECLVCSSSSSSSSSGGGSRVSSYVFKRSWSWKYHRLTAEWIRLLTTGVIGMMGTTIFRAGNCATWQGITCCCNLLLRTSESTIYLWSYRPNSYWYHAVRIPSTRRHKAATHQLHICMLQV